MTEAPVATVTSIYFAGLHKLSGANLESLKLEFLKLVKRRWSIDQVRAAYIKYAVISLPARSLNAN